MASLSTELPEGSNGVPILKTPTGIGGVDKVLLGGLPRGRASLVIGAPGTGKTVLALEFLYRGALAGEPGLFVTFEEPAAAIRRNAQALGWDLAALERDGRLGIMQADVPTNLVESGEFDITGLLAILAGQVKKLGARRVVIDAADVLLRIFRDPQRQENQLLMLHNWLLEQAPTAILTLKDYGDQPGSHAKVEYMADCVLRLDQSVVGQVMTRRLRVLKYRGSGFLSNQFPFVITSGGVVLIPISTVELAQQSVGPKFPTGVGGLDSLLDGGFYRGSCVLVAGSTGTGKTTLGCSLATTACRRGERVLYISFEESLESLATTVRSAGIDLRAALESRLLEVLTAMPEAMGVEEHLWRIFQAINRFDPQHLVIDAISACRRMGSETAAFDFLVRLLTHCKARGITCVYLNQAHAIAEAHEISGIGISSLVDALVVLEQDWPQNSHRRRLLIVKVRGSRHAHSHHTFQITDRGIQVGEAASATPVPQQERGRVHHE